MPNYTRRRRFSVQSEFGNGPILQNNFQNPIGKKSVIENFLRLEHVQKRSLATTKLENIIMHSRTRPLQIVAENEDLEVSIHKKNSNNITEELRRPKAKIQDVSGFTECLNVPPVIAQFNMTLNNNDPNINNHKAESHNSSILIDENECRPTRDISPSSNSQHKRDSRRLRILGQQHPIKVRSPKRIHKAIEAIPTELHETAYVAPAMTAVGVDPINFKLDHDTSSDDVILDSLNDSNERHSNHSIDDMCRICHGGDSLTSELGLLISACACRGTVGRIHVKCLERWLTESGKSRCELCGTRYATKRVHRYGLVKALFMWILSQNAKQLLIDILGIMLMSPLAVLAAWLSGRTLAGLMTQDYGNVSIWPLASTFVLACLTLVCYYCWIVSAATRHALGWWIWYRSQYEVRLELQELVENLLNQEAF